jgi:hypothetical protein
MINKEQLKQIIEDLVSVSKETRGIVRDEIIFSEACSYQRGILAQESKRENIKHFDNKKVPITESQSKFIKFNEKKLRNLGFDIDNIRSKSDAFKVIKEFKEMTNGKGNKV